MRDESEVREQTDLLLQWRQGAADFEYCIDLSGLSDLRRIRTDGQATHIGGLVTIASLQASEHLGAHFPVLVEMAGRFATPQIRNLATLGGNLCHAVPSADSAPPLIALDAEVVLLSASGERTLPLESFFTGAKQTALREGELLVEIRIPGPQPHSACAFERVARSVVDISLASAACRLAVDQRQRISQARVVLGAVAPTPLRSRGAEELLEGTHIDRVTDELLAQTGERAAADTRPISDVRTTAAYRKHMSNVLTRRAIEAAVRRLNH